MTDAASSGDLKYTRQTVTARMSWQSAKLFSLRITRDPAFQFQPGQFARLGLALGQEHLSPQDRIPNEWRAYSMVSHPSEAELEFFSVAVPEGQFSPVMANLQVGDPIWVDKTSFGFLTLERFVDGQDLWLISTGTGLSAFLPMLRDPTTWQRFARVLVVHGVRHATELAYRDEILACLHKQANASGGKLLYLPMTSQEPTTQALSPSLPAETLAPARLTTLLESGELEQRANVALDPASSRVMLCGNPAMVTDMRQLLSLRGFAAGRRGVPGNLSVENYW
jgi:ferredoxin--NADP+ reductase